MHIKIATIVQKYTQAEPSYDLVNSFLLNKPVVLYLCFPKILPIGSAKPSPNPLASIGITNSNVYPLYKVHNVYGITTMLTVKNWIVNQSKVLGLSSGLSSAWKAIYATQQRFLIGFIKGNNYDI